MHVRSVNHTSNFGNVQNLEQYLYLSVFREKWKWLTLSHSLNIYRGHYFRNFMFWYFLEAKSSCFVMKNCSQSSYICVTDYSYRSPLGSFVSQTNLVFVSRIKASNLTSKLCFRILVQIVFEASLSHYYCNSNSKLNLQILSRIWSISI